MSGNYEISEPYSTRLSRSPKNTGTSEGGRDSGTPPRASPGGLLLPRSARVDG